MDILAQSQQRGNLIQMVDDLTKQMQEQKEKFVDKGVLFTEKHAHQESIVDNKSKAKQIDALNQEVTTLRQSLSKLGTTNMSHDKEKQGLIAHINQLNNIVEQQIRDIEEFATHKGQLQSEIFYLKS